MTKQVGRGWVKVDRERFASYCRARGLAGDDMAMFLVLLIEADDRTGAIKGDLDAIAADVLRVSSRYVLRRRLPRLEALAVVLVERTNAPGKGAIVIVDYAHLNPWSRLAAEVRVGRESGGSRAGVVANPPDSPGETTPRQEDRKTEAAAPAPNGSGKGAATERLLPQQQQQQEEDEDLLEARTARLRAHPGGPIDLAAALANNGDEPVHIAALLNVALPGRPRPRRATRS